MPRKIAKSSRASRNGRNDLTARKEVSVVGRAPRCSSRSSAEVQGNTMSACRAIGFHHASFHDDRLRPAPGEKHAIEGLMVVEGVAARPPYDSNVGIGVAPAVVVELAARIEQQIGDSCDGNEVRHFVSADRQRGIG